MGPLKLSPGESTWITGMKITNFRSIAELDLTFPYRLTLLIGENGAGKTTVLDALNILLNPFADPPQPNDFRRVNGAATTSIDVELRQPAGATWAVFEQKGAVRHGQRETWIRTSEWVVAYYKADRSFGPGFSDLVEWFSSKDVEEARSVRDTRNLEYRDPELEQVRKCVSAVIPGATNLRIDPQTTNLVVDQTLGARTETFQVDQLAAGRKTMLALVADLARRIVTTDAGRPPKWPNVVLIDEIDLHLHPRWQLNVMQSLLQAFPTTQFIVTTHSEEIIASVPSDCVIALKNTDAGLVAGPIAQVQGATFDRVLEDAMGLPNRRPPEVEAMLDAYWKLVESGAGESPEALEQRTKLDELFQGNEPDLIRADLAIRRNRALRGAHS